MTSRVFLIVVVLIRDYHAEGKVMSAIGAETSILHAARPGGVYERDGVCQDCVCGRPAPGCWCSYFLQCIISASRHSRQCR